jgi:hypothetical protein
VSDLYLQLFDFGPGKNTDAQVLRFHLTEEQTNQTKQR